MSYLKIGKFVTTHGLNGEMKIISSLSDNGSIYDVGNTIYIGDDKSPFIIKRYRRHQKYDMITLDTLDSIEKISPYKGFNIYVKSDDIKEVLIENLIHYDVYNNDLYLGKVIEILKGVKYDFIVVSDKRIIIPFIDNFIVLVDKNHKIIKTNYMI